MVQYRIGPRHIQPMRALGTVSSLKVHKSRDAIDRLDARSPSPRLVIGSSDGPSLEEFVLSLQMVDMIMIIN